MVVIGLEEDIIPKLENDTDSTTTTTEDPVDAEITENEKTQILQNSELMESTKPLESLEAGQYKSLFTYLHIHTTKQLSKQTKSIQWSFSLCFQKAAFVARFRQCVMKKTQIV